jgi:hypothetical protein
MGRTPFFAGSFRGCDYGQDPMSAGPFREELRSGCFRPPHVTDFRGFRNRPKFAQSFARGQVAVTPVMVERLIRAIDITLSRCRLTELLAGSIDLTMQHQAPTNAPGDFLTLAVPVGLKRVGRELRMLVENADDQTAADPSLLRILARAYHIQARLIQNPELTVHHIAREEHVSAAYLYTLLHLPCLAPDITTAIVNGRKPLQLTAQTLMRLTPRLSPNWAEQRRLLGFR